MSFKDKMMNTASMIKKGVETLAGSYTPSPLDLYYDGLLAVLKFYVYPWKFSNVKFIDKVESKNDLTVFYVTLHDDSKDKVIIDESFNIIVNLIHEKSFGKTPGELE